MYILFWTKNCITNYKVREWRVYLVFFIKSIIIIALSINEENNVDEVHVSRSDHNEGI